LFLRGGAFEQCVGHTRAGAGLRIGSADRRFARGDIIAISFSMKPRFFQKIVEGLIEDDRVFVLLHEHGMQRGVEILPRADSGGLHRLKRVEHGAGPDRQTSVAQRAREIENVVGELALPPLARS
jgi:hypothetical protein